MSSSIVAQTQDQTPSFNLTPKSLEEALRFADIICKSDIIPKAYQGKPGNVLVAMQFGAEIGLAPLQAMQNIAVINGRPSIWGDAMLSIVRGSGKLEYIREDQTEEMATCIIKRKGEPEVTRTFSRADAIKASLWHKDGAWKAYPKRMMQMRARAFALRDVFPDVLGGLHIAEEAQDMPPEKNMGPAQVIQPQEPAEKPKSKTEALKAKIGAKETVTLANVKKEIESATSIAELEKVITKAQKLVSESDKQEAREAYRKQNQKLLAEQNTTIDSDTGEIIQDVETLSYAQVRNMLEKSQTIDELDMAADMIRDISGNDLQEELNAIYMNLKAKFSQPMS